MYINMYYLCVYFQLLRESGPSILRIMIKRIAGECVEKVIFVIKRLFQQDEYQSSMRKSK